jgi:DNA-binding LytR/AlgR family response regulator
MKKINLQDILVVESLKDYIKIITCTSKYIVNQTLSSFTESLPPERFLRIHRSYTISINKVDAIEGNCVEISGYKYTIGRSYLNEVKEHLLQ